MRGKRTAPAATAPGPSLRGRHLRWGWAALTIFVTLGLVLEALHGWKARGYLDVSASTRRFLWTLAHAHGTLLSLVNIAFALTASSGPVGGDPGVQRASTLLLLATILMPAGFFLGGISPQGGDPGFAVLLVAPGGLALLAAVALTARAVFRNEGR